MSIETTLDTMRTNVQALFPEHSLHYNRAVVSKMLGGKFVTYDFAFAPGYANIFHNAKGLIRLIIEDKDPRGQKDIDTVSPVEVEAILYEYRFNKAGVKFRKINAKNLDEACRKIVAWFAKNADSMKSVYHTMKD